MEQQLTQIPDQLIISQPTTINTPILKPPPTQITQIHSIRAADKVTDLNDTVVNSAEDTKKPNQQFILKPQTTNDQPSSRETDHDVSTPRECRPMAECSIASSLIPVSPNTRGERAPDFAKILKPILQRSTSDYPRSGAIANPQRSLNSINHSQSIAHQSNRYRKDPLASRRSTKCVVFNGTFPIDEPMSSRFDDGYAQDDGSESDYDEDIYREDDGEEFPDYEEDMLVDYRQDVGGSNVHHCEDGHIVTRPISMTTSSACNRDQLREEFETSANKFDQLMAQRRQDVFLHSVSECDTSKRIGKSNV